MSLNKKTIAPSFLSSHLAFPCVYSCVASSSSKCIELSYQTIRDPYDVCVQFVQF